MKRKRRRINYNQHSKYNKIEKEKDIGYKWGNEKLV